MPLTDKKYKEIMREYHKEFDKLAQYDEKLKTLKDLEEVKIYNIIGEPPEIAIKINDLKQEVIKWLNFIRRDVKEMHYDKGDKEGALYYEGQIDWIIQFFNIKEEDLKNEKEK